MSPQIYTRTQVSELIVHMHIIKHHIPFKYCEPYLGYDLFCYKSIMLFTPTFRCAISEDTFSYNERNQRRKKKTNKNFSVDL